MCEEDSAASAVLQKFYTADWSKPAADTTDLQTSGECIVDLQVRTVDVDNFVIPVKQLSGRFLHDLAATSSCVSAGTTKVLRCLDRMNNATKEDVKIFLNALCGPVRHSSCSASYGFAHVTARKAAQRMSALICLEGTVSLGAATPSSLAVAIIQI